MPTDPAEQTNDDTSNPVDTAAETDIDEGTSPPETEGDGESEGSEAQAKAETLPDSSADVAEYRALRLGRQAQQPKPGEGQSAAPKAEPDKPKPIFTDKHLQALRGQLDDDSLGALQALHDELLSARASLQKLQGPVDQMHGDYETRRKSEYAAAGKTCNSFFDKASKAGYSAVYGPSYKDGTPAQQQARHAVGTKADEIMQDFRQAGAPMTWERAVAIAHGELVNPGSVEQPQAIAHVQGQMERRSRQITVPPGTRGSAGPSGNKVDPRKRAVSRWSEARRK